MPGSNDEDLKAADEILSEAYMALQRGIAAEQRYDNAGAIQACQQCIELSTKALYRAVGLDHPKTHQPGKELAKVLARFENLDEYWRIAIGRISWIDSMWEWAHNVSFYGTIGIPPSRLFSQEDAKIAINYARKAHSDSSMITTNLKTGILKRKTGISC